MSVLSKKEEKELLKEIEGVERIEKEVSLSWDSRNLILRIPKEVSDFFGLTKESRFKKNFKFIIEAKDHEIKKMFDIVERTKPKKTTKKKKNDK